MHRIANTAIATGERNTWDQLRFFLKSDICYNHTTMSLLYHKRSKTAIKWAFVILALIIIVSMVLTYSAGIG